MKWPFLWKTANVLAAAAVAFLCYGGGRTLDADFGLSWRGFATGIILTAMALGATSALAWLLVEGAFSLWKGRGPQWSRAAVKSLALTLLCGSLLGAAISEVTVQVDEHHFIHEAETAQAHGSGQMARDRCWPNGSASLIWAPDHGFWATD